MKDLILFAFRDMIRKIIDQYIQWRRDEGLNEEAAEELRKEYDNFNSWLYGVLVGHYK